MESFKDYIKIETRGDMGADVFLSSTIYLVPFESNYKQVYSVLHRPVHWGLMLRNFICHASPVARIFFVREH